MSSSELPRPVDSGDSDRTAPDRFDKPLAMVALVAVLGSMMTVLDSTVVNVAIDTLSRAFDAPLPTIQWATGGYLLALAVAIPVTGWASDRFGTKRLYQFSMVVFLLGSVLAGTAWSAPSLIAFRVLQGLGGGMILPVAMTMVTRAAGRRRVGRAMSLVGAPLLIGPILGPALGGWLIEALSWRWIFYINVPIGLVAIAVAAAVLPRDEPEASERLDVVGLVLLTCGIGLLTLGLGLGSATAWIVVLVGAVLLVLFVGHSRRHAQPVLDVRLFARRPVAAAGLSQFLFSVAFFGSMLLIPLYFQVVRGESALGAGALLVPYGVGAAVSMAVSGRITDRSGPRGVVLVGLGLLVVGLLILTGLAADTPYPVISLAQLLLGLGMGATMLPSMSAAYQAVSTEEIARVTAAVNVVVRLGGAFGVALLATVLTWYLPADGSTPVGGDPTATRETTAAAFAATFWWAVAVMAAAVVAAALIPGRPARESELP